MKEIYPKSHQEFLNWFKSEAACWKYLYQLRWPEGFSCPLCQNTQAWHNGRKLLRCTKCRHETSITAGTLFHGTRKPLLLWFNVIWLVMAQKTGSSAQNLKEAMGFGSYETTWSWGHKLRRAMIRPGRNKLKGDVEVDETFIGGKKEGARGRGAQGKTLVVVATECLGKKCGRVRFMCIPNASEKYLLKFIEEYIEEGSRIITDGWKGYNGLNKSKYEHEIKIIKGSGKKAHELLPHVHLIDSLLKKWINGTHQGNMDPYHLPYYLDEFAFRFNRRLSNHRGKLFCRMLQQSLITPPTPYKSIVKTKVLSDDKEQLSKLKIDLQKSNKTVWALKKIKTVAPIVESTVRELARLEPIQFIKLTGDAILASSEVDGSKIKDPVTKPFHSTAIGIYLVFDFHFKTLEFCEINSPTKGWGEKMVRATLQNLPKDWSPSLVFDWSDGFWGKMQKKYNHLEWLII